MNHGAWNFMVVTAAISLIFAAGVFSAHHDQFKDDPPLVCPVCGWTGTPDDLRPGNWRMTPHSVTFYCPNNVSGRICNTWLAEVHIP